MGREWIETEQLAELQKILTDAGFTNSIDDILSAFRANECGLRMPQAGSSPIFPNPIIVNRVAQELNAKFSTKKFDASIIYVLFYYESKWPYLDDSASSSVET